MKYLVLIKWTSRGELSRYFDTQSEAEEFFNIYNKGSIYVENATLLEVKELKKYQS